MVWALVFFALGLLGLGIYTAYIHRELATAEARLRFIDEANNAERQRATFLVTVGLPSFAAQPPADEIDWMQDLALTLSELFDKSKPLRGMVSINIPLPVWFTGGKVGALKTELRELGLDCTYCMNTEQVFITAIRELALAS